MNTDEILRVLEKEFSLRLNEKIIMKSLLEQTKLTADEICVKTEIPKGRVYEYLNSLIEKELILKTQKLPTEYYIDSLEKRIIEYSCKELYTLLKKQEKIINEIKESENITPITDANQFTLIRTRERFMTRKLNHLVRDNAYPLFFYPIEYEEEYIKYREKLRGEKGTNASRKMMIILSLRSFKEMIQKKQEIKYIISEGSFENYAKEITEKFGKKETVKRLEYIKKFMDENKIEIKVIQEPNAYSLILMENSLIFIILEPPLGETFVNGFLLRGRKSVERYSSIFNIRFEKGTPLQKVINEKLREMK